MAQPEDFGLRNRPHISISGLRETVAYTFPTRAQERKPLRDDYASHAAALLDQLTAALGDLPPAAVDQRLQVEGLKRGAVVEVSTLPPKGPRTKAVKVPAALEFPAQDIVVLRSERNDDRTETALLFVPDDARAFLRGRIAEYGRDPGNRRRPDLERFEAIESVETASVNALFVGEVDLSAPEIVWWELWVQRAGGLADRLAARALTVDSARWPQPISKQLIGRSAHWKTGSKGKKQQILREVGYGVPDIERAILSARNDVTLIAEAEIRPFGVGADKRTAVFNEMHFYDLPWPKAALERLENEIVTMKSTLSYFIEPNLTGKAATRPDTYRSYGLRFAMKKRSETAAAFRARVNASQEKDGSVGEDERSCWLLGPKAIQAGSLHCDLWRGYAIDLAGHDTIAVYPVGGWWKTHVGQRRMTDKGRYALVISISAPGQAIDLHTEVSNLVETKEIEALIG